MRISTWLNGVLVVQLCVACGKKTESDISAAKAAPSAIAQPVPAAQAALSAASVRATIGGNVVVLGSHTVELVLHAEGTIEARIADLSGKLLGSGAGVRLMALAPTSTEDRAELQLAWSPEMSLFVGHVKPGVELRGGPVEVELTVGGAVATGKLAAAAVVTGPRYGGTLLAAGEYGAEVGADVDGGVEARLWDARLRPVTGEAGLEVVANIAAEGQAAQNVTLEWDGPRACFAGQGRLHAAGTLPTFELRVGAGANASVGRLARVALLGKAQHGGMVLAAGDYSVELVGTAPRLVQAFVMDASGKAHAGGDLKLQLALQGVPELSLAWHAPCACYRAELDSNLDLLAKPIQLRIVGDGRVRLAAAAKLMASANVDLKAKADLDAEVAADAKAGLRAGVAAPKVGARAQAVAGKAASARATATVGVKPPSVSVKAGTKKSAGASAGFKLGTQ